MKILLTDDSQFMRMVLKGIVEKAYPQAEFLEAGNGVEALSLYKTHAPDLLLLDLVMPEKGGIEVLKELGGKKGAVIVISAVGQDAIMQEAKGLGADAFILKPFEEENVRETLRKVLPPLV